MGVAIKRKKKEKNKNTKAETTPPPRETPMDRALMKQETHSKNATREVLGQKEREVAGGTWLWIGQVSEERIEGHRRGGSGQP